MCVGFVPFFVGAALASSVRRPQCEECVVLQKPATQVFLQISRSGQDLEGNSSKSNVSKDKDFSGLGVTRSVIAESIDVAVVGSGPLTDHDRELIATAQELYRFNSMPNLKMGEHVGTVFLRRDGYVGDRVWGLGGADGACPRITEANGIVIIGGGQSTGQGSAISQHKLVELRNKFSKVDVAKESCTQLTIDGHTYHSNLHKPNALFSTGFIGLSHVLNNSPLVKKGSKVHVFGMNWKKESVHSGGHPFDVEKKVVHECSQILVHETDGYFYKPRDESGKMRWSCEHNETPAKVEEVTALLQFALQ